MSEQVIRISIEVPVFAHWSDRERQHQLLTEATDRAIEALEAAVTAAKAESHE